MFICGESYRKGFGNMPISITVCPAEYANTVYSYQLVDGRVDTDSIKKARDILNGDDTL